MIAAKHFDPVMGMDIHINLIPTPGGPVPTPLPHIYAGMVFDPFDFVPVIGQTISVNGKLLLAAQPMTECKFFGQVPMAGPFAKPPEMVGEIMLGSMTVGSQSMALADMPSALLSMPAAIASIPGEFGKSPLGAWVGDVMGSSDDEPAPEPPAADNTPQPEAPTTPDAPPPPEPPPPPTSVYPLSRLGDMVLGCADVGSPAPTSKDKKGGIKGLTFIGGVVMAIPMGAPVLVGGGPAPAPLSAFAMKFLMKFGMSALKKVLGSALKKFNDLLQTKFPDNPVSKKLCDWGFEPVDIARGKVMTSREDFALPGPIPLVWECIYYSNTRYIDGPLGARWSHSYDMYLETDIIEEISVIKLRMSDGRLALFPQLELGESYYNRQEKLELFKDENGFFLRNADRLYYRFEEKGERWRLLHIKDTSDNTILFDYDEQGALKKITDSVGRELQVDTDAFNRILSIHVPHPTTKNKTFPIIRYEYDKEGDLIAAYNAHDNAFRYKYHKHLMTQLTYRDGLSFYYKYDSEEHTARCIHTYGDGDLYKGNLHYEEGKTTIERIVGHPDGHTDTYTEIYYHDGAVVHHKIDALGNETKYEYNEFYELQAETDPLGYKTNYSYDDMGNCIKVSYPDKAQIELSYKNALIEKIIDPIGGKWHYFYNKKGNLVERIDSEGSSTRYTYNDDDEVSTVVDTNSGRVLFGYDDRKNINQITTPDNASSRWKYDILGRVIQITEPTGSVHKRKYDLLGQVTEIQEPDGNKRFFEYDTMGRIVHSKDNHSDIFYEYRGIGQKITKKRERNRNLSFKYDSDERLVEISNENDDVYNFDLDANGNIVTESSFDEVKRYYKRDKCGRPVTIQKVNGIESNYTYDSMGSILRVAHSNGEEDRFVYREDGYILEARNRDSTIFFERDLLGRVLSENQNGVIIKSVYDSIGMRTHVSTSLGFRMDIDRNNMGDVLKVNTESFGQKWEMQFKRDIMGLELERILPGGVKETWERDQLGRPLKHSVWGKAGEKHHSRTYEWDVNDRLKRHIDFGTKVTQFHHDNHRNLIGSTYPNGDAENRIPDKVRNLYKNKNRSDRQYGKGGRLIKAKRTTYEYDEEGNLTKKTDRKGNVWQYSWNASGLLKKVIRPDGKHVDFGYDTFGRRMSKAYNEEVTRWVWDENTPIHEWKTDKNQQYNLDLPYQNEIRLDFKNESDEEEIIFIEKKPYAPPNDSSTETIIIEDISITEKTSQTPLQSTVLDIKTPTNLVTWIFEPDTFTPIGKLTKEQQFSVQTNHVGTPISMYDKRGRRVWQTDTNTYGDLRNLSGNRVDCPFRFPGQYEDEETGLYYNRFRYYDPENGIYISQDPLGLLSGEANFYAYVKDTNTWIDVLGLVVDPTYTRGSQGEIKTARVTVTKSDLGTGTGTNASSRSHARGMGSGTEDAGHVIGKRLGGSGGVDHVFPQNPKINRGEFRVFEGRVADLVKTTGSADISIRLKYSRGKTRPHTIVYEAKGADGTILSEEFRNPC